MLKVFGDHETDIVTVEVSWQKIEIKQRHEIEKLVDKRIRENNIGYCSGGENGERRNFICECFHFYKF